MRILSSSYDLAKISLTLANPACTLKSVLSETREWRSIHTWQNLLSLLLSILPWLIPIHLSSLLLQWRDWCCQSHISSPWQAFKCYLGSDLGTNLCRALLPPIRLLWACWRFYCTWADILTSWPPKLSTLSWDNCLLTQHLDTPTLPKGSSCKECFLGLAYILLPSKEWKSGDCEARSEMLTEQRFSGSPSSSLAWIWAESSFLASFSFYYGLSEQLQICELHFLV